MSEPIIHHVSDTARWVACYRAMESERPDAHFHDFLARRLAGDRGEEIVRRLPAGRRNSWALVVRTCVIDEMIISTIKKGKVDAVLNLAAGLDARPYRLPLPPKLRWIEADLPEITRYKESVVKGEIPVCKLERVKVDLSDRKARRRLFAKIAEKSKRVLVLTEGFLVYLDPSQVDLIAEDIRDQKAFRWWIQDFVSPFSMRYVQRRWGKVLEQGNSTWKFFPEQGPAYFGRFGWKASEFRDSLTEARRLKRPMPGDWMIRAASLFAPAKVKEQIAKSGTGIALMERG